MTNTTPQSNPLRGRFNAWMMAKFEDDFHQETGERKAAALGGFRGTVIEIGPGNGNNFRYYPPGVRLVVYEPNPHMHPRLLEAARAHGVNHELRARSAEDLEFDDNSVDAVVCTLVLCTVQNPARVISEVHRVLKPGGRFFFIEHVAAAPGTKLRKWQDLLDRPWRWMFEGCHTNRETASLLETAGFNQVEIESFTSEKMPPLIVPQIAGVAIK